MAETSPIAIVPPGTGKTYWVASDLVTIKATGEQTGGLFSLIETTVVPQAGPPPHIHHHEDEWFYILEGELTFFIAGTQQTATAGTLLHGPKNILHTFKNLGTTPARMLVWMSPAGFENFFAEVGVPIAEGETPPQEVTGEHIERLLAVAPKYQLEIPPPPGA